MGRFQTTHTQAQRLAATRARATRGWSYQTISEKAARGELEGAGRFSVKPNTVGKWCRADLADYQPERLNDADHAVAAIETARAGLLAGILAERDAWEKERKAGNTDLPQAGRILRALQDWQRTSTETAKPKAGSNDAQNPETSDTADSIVAALLERARSNGNADQNTASLPSERNGQAEGVPLTPR